MAHPNQVVFDPFPKLNSTHTPASWTSLERNEVKTWAEFIEHTHKMHVAVSVVHR
jgi:hypothetical protein